MDGTRRSGDIALNQEDLTVPGLQRELARLRARISTLEAEARRFKTTLQSIGDAVISVDTSGNIVQMNPAAEALTGWHETEAAGQPLAQVFRIVNEETRAEVESPVDRVLREGTVVGLANHTLLVARDGTMRPMADSGAPIRGENGEITGVVFVFRDQTVERATLKSLRESEERFRETFERSTVGKSLTDPGGRLLRVNRAFADMLGLSIEEMQAVNFAQITHPDDIAETRECIRCLLAGERSTYRMDKRYRHRDGHIVFADVSTTLLRDHSGAPLHLITSIVDISERKRSEAALRASELRLRRFYESGLLGVIFWNMRGQITDANDKFLEMVGYTRAELDAGQIDWLGMTPPEYRHVDEASVAELQATGANRVPFEKEYVRKDGTRIPIVLAGAMLDEERFEGVAFVLDISQRKRMEERVSHLNLVLQAIRNVNQLIVREKDAGTLIRRSCEVLTETRGYFAAWIALYDESGNYLTAASAGLGGAFESLAAHLGSGQPTACRRALHAPGVHVVRHPAVECPSCPAASLRRNQSAIAVRLEHEGRVHGLLVMSMDPGLVDRAEERSLIEEVADDIAYALHGLEVEKQRGATEEDLRKHRDDLEQRVRDRTAELEASNQELEAFSYSVSHDLRAPLRAIDGFTRILADDYSSHLNTEGLRLCSVVRGNTAKMSQLIDDLLAFSRLGRAEMCFSRIDMGTLASSIFHEIVTPECRARIHFQVGTLPPAVGDPTLMRQVWTNLLSNAIKFSSKRERAVIGVSAAQVEGESVYAVADNGAGFDMQYVHKLFGVFQRLHSTREFEGNGVGLALVQRVIRRHGGRVWAEGEPDRGATFSFALPHEGA